MLTEVGAATWPSGDPLEGSTIAGLLELEEVEGADSGVDVNGYEADPDEDATGHKVKNELQRAVLLAGAAPDPYEQVHGNYCELVEEKQEEEV